MVSVPVKGGMQIKTTLHTASCQSEMSVIKMPDNIRGPGEDVERDNSDSLLRGGQIMEINLEVPQKIKSRIWSDEAT